MTKKILLEKNIARMEEIVDLLENNDLDLEKALKLFEEGITLSKLCQERLAELEQRVRLLTRDSKGRVSETDMAEV
ncbi:MAG: exodeoxyribonuclease VII small subunit [Candidatus Marinimicrobia bacterium]|nr:exodeoxyribonuclease VII small subunit [Candidatus Neomarinimicrobiota bacterium]